MKSDDDKEVAMKYLLLRLIKKVKSEHDRWTTNDGQAVPQFKEEEKKCSAFATIQMMNFDIWRRITDIKRKKKRTKLFQNKSKLYE